MSTSGSQQSDGPSQSPVFLSYCSTDRKATGPILEALKRAGFSVWWDGMISGGEDFAESIEKPLTSALAVIVLWSKASIASHWVRDEAAIGRDRGCLVPVSLDGSEPPLGFRQVQTIPYVHDHHSGLAAIIHAVTALQGREQPVPPPASRWSVLLDRRATLAGGGLLMVGGAAALWRSGIIGGRPVTANSVAVLPFDNLSNVADEAYFSDGLAAEVRTELAQNPLLQVAAQTSSNKFRDSKDDARTITRALGVHFLLDGSVRKAGDKVRISAELIEGETGLSRWAQIFERPLANVFAVQEEIAQTVTQALTQQLADHAPGAGRSRQGGTSNVDAYEAYLRGRDLFNRAADEPGDQAALAMFDRAIAADHDYALAFAARARSLTVIGNQYDQGIRRRGHYADAIVAARRAVALAPDSAEAQSALGFALFNGHIDATAARGPYERSFALGQGDADVLSRYALYSARCGRIEPARLAIARAAKLDALNARIFRFIGEVEYCARNYQGSIPPIERALTLNPDLSVAHSAIGAARLMLGQVAAARADYAREPSSLFGLTGLAIVDRKLGNAAAAEKSLAALIAEHGDNSLYQQAQVLAQWGRKEDAIQKLDAAFVEGDAGLVYANRDPLIDPLRQDARFISLLHRLGFV